MKRKTKIIIYAVLTVLVLLYLVIETPVLSPLYLEGALFWAVVVTAYVLVWSLLRFGEFIPLTQSQRVFSYVPNQKFPRPVLVILILPWAFLLLVLI